MNIDKARSFNEGYDDGPIPQSMPEAQEQDDEATREAREWLKDGWRAEESGAYLRRDTPDGGYAVKGPFHQDLVDAVRRLQGEG